MNPYFKNIIKKFNDNIFLNFSNTELKLFQISIFII